MRCTSESYNVYLTQIQQLTEYDFTQDYHVKSMFVFPAGTKLHEHYLYLENKIILQDKVCLPRFKTFALLPINTHWNLKLNQSVRLFVSYVILHYY